MFDVLLSLLSAALPRRWEFGCVMALIAVALVGLLLATWATL